MPNLLDQLTAYSVRYHVIHLEWATALERLHDRDGDLIDSSAATAATQERDQAAAEEFIRLLPCADALLDAARTALDAMPSAPHHGAWRLLLDDLAHAADHARRILSSHPDLADETTMRERDAALWPYLTTWYEHSLVLCDLADQHRVPEPHPALPVEDEQRLTALVRAAKASGRLYRDESWYDATGQQITLARIDDPSGTTGDEVFALAGDVDSPDMRVIGRFAGDQDAWRSLPPPVPAGVLRPDRSHEAGPLTGPALRIDALIRDVLDSSHTGAVAESIDLATDPHPPHRGPMVRLTEFVDACAEFASALDTRAGLRLAAQLDVLATQLTGLTRELRSIGEELGDTVAVLPPYRARAPRHVTTAPASQALTAQRPGSPTTQSTKAGSTQSSPSRR